MTVYTVRDLVSQLRYSLEDGFYNVFVEGEISGLGSGPTGHLYFDLKDTESKLRCVMFQSFARLVGFPVENGAFVVLRGTASVYERAGSMQLKVFEMHLVGVGTMARAIEVLRRQLKSEGLFEPSRKRPLPAFPNTVGIVTSGQGAARHDIRKVIGKRFPLARIVLCPVLVQGPVAAEQIARAIHMFNALPAEDPRRPDVLIVGRGGGSLEDLAAFSDETVARALFASKIPTISAVGHENDTSIADDVADVRAATPSNAAELAVPDRRAIAAAFRSLHDRLRGSTVNMLRQQRKIIERLAQQIVQTDEAVFRLGQRLDNLAIELVRGGERRLLRSRIQLEAANKHLEAVDPGRPMRRGYARVERSGRHVRSVAELDAGDRVMLSFRDGQIPARIESKERA